MIASANIAIVKKRGGKVEEGEAADDAQRWRRSGGRRMRGEAEERGRRRAQTV